MFGPRSAADLSVEKQSGYGRNPLEFESAKEKVQLYRRAASRAKSSVTTSPRAEFAWRVW